MASSLFLTINLSDVSHIACGSLEARDELGRGVEEELVKHGSVSVGAARDDVCGGIGWTSWHGIGKVVSREELLLHCGLSIWRRNEEATKR